MTAIIETEKLTKSYGTHRGIIDVDLEVNEGEAFGFLGPNGAGKTTTIRTLLDHIRPTSGRARVFGIETTADPVAIHRRIGYLPGEFALYDRLTGGQTIDYFANLRGGVDPAYQAELIEPPRPRSDAQVQGVLEGQQAEDRAGHRPPAPARAAASSTSRRPASTRSSSRRSTRSSARPRPRAARLPLEPHPRPRSSGRATGWRSSATAGWPGSIASRPCATLPTTRSSCVFAGAVPTAEFEALPGVSDVVADDHILRMRVSGRSRRSSGPRPGTSCSTSSAASRRSRRRSWPSTATPPPRRGRLHDSQACSGRRGRRVRTVPAHGAGMYGLGSVYGKTIRDSRRAIIIVGSACSSLFIGVSEAIALRVRDPPASRQNGRRLIKPCRRSWPALGRPDPVNVGTLGGYHLLQVRHVLPGSWSACGRSLALSGTLAARGPAGEPGIRRGDPLGRADDRAREAGRRT